MHSDIFATRRMFSAPLDISNLQPHRWFVERNPTRPRCWNLTWGHRGRMTCPVEATWPRSTPSFFRVCCHSMTSAGWKSVPAIQNGFAVFAHPLFPADHVVVARIVNGNANETGCGKRRGFSVSQSDESLHFYVDLWQESLDSLVLTYECMPELSIALFIQLRTLRIQDRFIFDKIVLQDVSFFY